MALNVIVRKCMHCNYEWVQRFDRKPKACPACCNYNYDQPRQRRAHNNRRKTQSI